MDSIDSIFEGLYGYEKLMLICGFVLFVFTLAAITVMIVQRRSFKAALVLFVFAIVLMGFPGIQAVKFSKDMVELDRIRDRPQPPTDPAKQQQTEQALANLEQRAAGNPSLQAKVADGYRAIGEVDKAYQLAQSVLRQKPPAQVQATLVPVLTAKLNQVQADAPVAEATKPTARTDPATAGSATGTLPSTATNPVVTPIKIPVVSPSKQREITAIAGQLQRTDAPLTADSHAALAKAYAVLGQPKKAKANVEAARRLDPRVRINPIVLRSVKSSDEQPLPEQ